MTDVRCLGPPATVTHDGDTYEFTASDDVLDLPDAAAEVTADLPDFEFA